MYKVLLDCDKYLLKQDTGQPDKRTIVETIHYW